MADLQSGEGRMMIDSVVCAQYINVMDTQQSCQLFLALTVEPSVFYCQIGPKLPGST